MIISILDNLIDIAKKFPSRVALKDINNAYTWEETVELVRRVASGLLKIDRCLANKRFPIPVLMNKSADEIVAFWGVAYIGDFYVPIDDKMPAERVRKIIAALGANYIICDREHVDFVSAIDGVIPICIEDLYNTGINSTEIEKCRESIIDTDPLYALFTSGSTGEPKGVVCNHRSVLNYSEWVVETFGYTEDTVSGNQTPFYFSMSVLDIYANLKCGGLLTIIPPELFMQPKKLIVFLNEEHINTIYWVPSALCFLSRLKAMDQYEILGLKKVLFAGEVMPTKQLNYWRKKVPGAMYANLFGPTEITDIGIYYILDRDLADDEPVPIGKKCRNVDIFVLDERGQLAGYDTPGELFYRGSFLGMGYYGDDEKTKSKYIQNPLNDKYPETVYSSGDIVKYNDKGELIYISRKDNQIKHRGNRIELGEIESAICSADGVARACSFFDEEKDKIVAAILVENTATYDAIITNVKSKVKEKLPEYMRPTLYFEVSDMPLNANGKIDRIMIKQRYMDTRGERL